MVHVWDACNAAFYEAPVVGAMLFWNFVTTYRVVLVQGASIWQPPSAVIILQ
jgi:hypothetical protein